MSLSSAHRSARALIRPVVTAMTGGPQVLAFLPAVTLAAYWLGGEGYLLVTAVVVPALFAAGGLFTRSRTAPAIPARADGLPGRTSAVARAEALLAAGDPAEATFAILVVGIDDAREFEARLGPAAFRDVTDRTGDRIVASVRATDLVARLDASRFAVVLSGPRASDVETLLQLSARLQSAVGAPLAIGGARLHPSASVGLARPGPPALRSGEALLAAAEQALAEAAAQGPGAVRAYARRAAPPAMPANGLASDVAAALAAGQIVPWFQPQVQADSGALSGIEALARWVHPTLGVLPPAEFLPAAEAAGLGERLGATMLHASLAALHRLDEAGFRLPHVSVNFAAADLRNPHIPDRVRWELDRFGLAPGRLRVEILETVIDDADDDMVTRSLSALAALGCGIDLDDFGTGHAAIGSIRRFSVRRVKIDRSFVRRIDTDADQQALVSAMILMGDRLGIDTLAEGVETAAEQAALARLGCRHVQGYAVARPMPEEALVRWLAARGDGAAPIALAPRQAGSGGAATGAGKTA